MKLSEIGNLTIVKPNITVRDFFNSVIVFNIYRLNEVMAKDFCYDRCELIYNGKEVIYSKCDKESNEEINMINQVYLQAKESNLYCIQIGNDSRNDDYVRLATKEIKNKIMLCFYEFGAVSSLIENYEGRVIFACTQEDKTENTFFQKIFFVMEDEQKTKEFEKEMESYFVEEK